MAYQTGSSGANLLFGLGGRIIGGAVGFLAGGPSGAVTGWQVGGSAGDSFAKPIVQHQQQFYTGAADPTAMYNKNLLNNRQYGYHQTESQVGDWSQYVTKGLDTLVNIGSASGLIGKLDDKYGTDPIWKKNSRLQSTSGQALDTKPTKLSFEKNAFKRAGFSGIDLNTSTPNYVTDLKIPGAISPGKYNFEQQVDSDLSGGSLYRRKRNRVVF